MKKGKRSYFFGPKPGSRQPASPDIAPPGVEALGAGPDVQHPLGPEGVSLGSRQAPPAVAPPLPRPAAPGKQRGAVPASTAREKVAETGSPEPSKAPARTKGVIEIRVHGVSGTPQQDMLCSQWAEQVAGDENAPIFQPADQFGHTVPGPGLSRDDEPLPRQIEAYHWGEMTSGGWSKAVWTRRP